MEAGQEDEDAPGTQHIHLTLSSICGQGDAAMQDADPRDGSPFLLTDSGPNGRRESCRTEARSIKHPESLNKPPIHIHLISNLPMPYVQQSVF